MLERIGAILRPRAAPSFVFLAVFALVFLLVVVTSTLVTFLLPESYSSTARIKVGYSLGDRAGQAEFEAIESGAVLGKVIEDFDLNQAWGRKHAQGGRLKTPETIALLKARIDLRPVRGSSVIEIRVFGDDRDEAAKIANAIAQTYREDRTRSGPVEIVDMAVPGLRPVRPNKPLNIALGILAGMLLGLVAGAGMAGLAALRGRKSRRNAALPGTDAAPPSDLPHPDGRRAKSIVDKIMGILWMGIGGVLSGLALVALVWLLIFQQSRVTGELLFLAVFGLCWGCNAVLGFFLLRGRRWARICLGMEGVMFLIYFYFRFGLPLPPCPAWVSTVTFRLGTFIVGVLPCAYWVFIPLGFASVCALWWPRKKTATSPG